MIVLGTDRSNAGEGLNSIMSSPNVATASSVVGAVVIGRNEGERLRACLTSVCAQVPTVVYVDSGSTDGSLDLARSLGVCAIALDPAMPFTAARGRQTGLDELCRLVPGIEFVQFIDGDCILQPGWIADANEFLQSRSDVVAVCGRRREEHAATSFYSQLIDVEWDIPPGEVRYFGGDTLVRVRPVYDVGGWSTDLIAGEEPDLSFRMRKCGWRIWRLPREATLHDIAMSSFRQYWKRAERSGFGYCQVGLFRHRGAQCGWAKQTMSILMYGAVLPLILIPSLVFFPLSALLVLILYARLLYAMTSWCTRRGYPLRTGLAYGGLGIICKFAGFLGILRLLLRLATGRHAQIIEYRIDESASGKACSKTAVADEAAH